MRFEKKDTEIRIDPFNTRKNLWAGCLCTYCKIPFERQNYIDSEGKTHFDWAGESITGQRVWECAKCLYEQKVV